MPTLEELLRASLKGANEKFDQANKALHAAVVEVAKAVEAATSGKATVRLQIQSSDESGTRYSLSVVINGSDDFRNLGVFFVAKKGFPIQRTDVGETFASAEALTASFQKLASDPDSPLVGYLAYIVRNSPDPIPF